MESSVWNFKTFTSLPFYHIWSFQISVQKQQQQQQQQITKNSNN